MFKTTRVWVCSHCGVESKPVSCASDSEMKEVGFKKVILGAKGRFGDSYYDLCGNCFKEIEKFFDPRFSDNNNQEN
jgi:hypothetical protein